MPFTELAGIPKKYPLKVALVTDCANLAQEALNRCGINEEWGTRFIIYRRKYLDRSSREWREQDEEAARVIETYERLLDENGLIDFDGMVQLGLHLVENFEWVRNILSAKYPVLVVDEYQDLGIALDRIVNILCFHTGIRLLAVGDPDQSIYGFQGAEPSLLKNLAVREDVESVQLHLNYRCGSRIIRASTAALDEKRDFQSSIDEPGIVYIHECKGGLEEQVKLVCNTIIPNALEASSPTKLGSIAVLYRQASIGDRIADAVSAKGWNYIRVDRGNPYQATPLTYWLEDCAKWCSDGWRSGEPRLSDLIRQWHSFNARITSPQKLRMLTIDFVKFLYNHRLYALSFNTWLNDFLDNGLRGALNEEPLLRDEKLAVDKLQMITSTGQVLASYTVSTFGGLGGSPEHLNLSTMHASKGLEYNIVIMIGLEQGIIPGFRDGQKELAESRRIFYVGLTRAKYEVYLLYSGWYEAPIGYRRNNGPSRFIAEIQQSLSV